MKKRRMLVATLAAASVLVAALTGCSSDDETQGGTDTPTTGGDLVLARGADTVTLLAPEAGTNESIYVIQQLYDTLTRNSMDGTEIEPGLAENWEQDPDDLASWTFSLREGVTFHDGSALDAEDVKFSLDYARTESDTNQWSYLLAPIVEVTVVDDSTIEIATDGPWSQLPAYLAVFNASIYPAEFGGESEEYMRTNANGTGPFAFDSWATGQELKIVKNDSYWEDGLPKLDSVTFKVVADDNTRLLQLQSGEIHIDQFPSSQQMGVLEASSGVTGTGYASTQTVGLNVNTRIPGLDDADVRRALSLSVDRQGIIDSVYQGFASVLSSPLASSSYGYDTDLEQPTTDLDEAKALMAASDYADGLSLTLQYRTGNADYEQIAQVLQNSWSEIGVELELSPVDANTGSANTRSGDFDLGITSWTDDVADPTAKLDYYLDAENGNGLNNGYFNQEVPDLLADAAAAETPEQALEDYGKIQEIAVADLPFIPLFELPLNYAQTDKVQGFRVSPYGSWDLKNTSLTE